MPQIIPIAESYVNAVEREQTAGFSNIAHSAAFYDSQVQQQKLSYIARESSAIPRGIPPKAIALNRQPLPVNPMIITEVISPRGIPIESKEKTDSITNKPYYLTRDGSVISKSSN